MARHRNVRTLDYDEEYEGYYSCYGHSVEDDFCISPRTEAQFLYDRNASEHSMSAFFDSSSTVLPEEDENNSEDIPDPNQSNSQNVPYTNMSDTDIAKLQSCIEAMQNVVGDTVSENILSKAARDHSFDLEKALNAVLSGQTNGYQTLISKSDDPELKKKASVKKCTTRPCDEMLKNNSSSQKIDTVLVLNSESAVGPAAVQQKARQDTSDKILAETPAFLFNTESSSATLKVNIPGKGILDVYEKERSNEKPLINLVVVGHVDAGKSTLMGHMLFRLGCVSKKTMHKYEQDSKKLGKASFAYAWVLDETSEERTRGITMDVAQSKFETLHRTVNLLDAPGHKDFIPNMITGAAQADVAILVVDATRGEFETGFETGGQTREHTMLIRSLGVSQLAVVINKLDNVNWDQGRYNEIVSKLASFLKQTGFKDSDVKFVPCSGLTGENLIKPPEIPGLTIWYSGPTLVDIVDSFKPPERLVSKPLRICISDVFKGISGRLCVSGRIEAGCIQNGDKVLVMPSGEQAIVKGIAIGDITAQHGFAGDHVIVQVAGIDINNVTSGSVVCAINQPVKVTTRFQARLVIFNIVVPITKGFPVILHYQSMSDQAVIKKIISQLHKSTGQILKTKPRCLTKNSSAVVEIEVMRPICLELYKDFKDLGRFMLRSGGSTVAAGMVTEIF